MSYFYEPNQCDPLSLLQVLYLYNLFISTSVDVITQYTLVPHKQHVTCDIQDGGGRLNK